MRAKYLVSREDTGTQLEIEQQPNGLMIDLVTNVMGVGHGLLINTSETANLRDFLVHNYGPGENYTHSDYVTDANAEVERLTAENERLKVENNSLRAQLTGDDGDVKVEYTADKNVPDLVHELLCIISEQHLTIRQTLAILERGSR